MYGVSTAETLVSDLVSTGIVRELYLDVLVETFNKWLTKYLVHEMTTLGEAEKQETRGRPFFFL